MTEKYSTIMKFNSKDELLKVWKGMFDNQSNSISLLEEVNVPDNFEDKDKWFYQNFGCTFDVCSASIDEEKFEMNLQTESGLTSEIIQKIADMFNVNPLYFFTMFLIDIALLIFYYLPTKHSLITSV